MFDDEIKQEETEVTEPAEKEVVASEKVPETTEGEVSEHPAEPETPPVEQGPRIKTKSSGTAIAAFIFFVITACIFVVYEYLSYTFLYKPLMESIDNFGEAIAAIFGYIFGLIYTLIFAIAQLPANIVSIILFKRLRKKSEEKGAKITFTVFFALSIVMLLVTVLSTALFFGMSAFGG